MIAILFIIMIGILIVKQFRNHEGVQSNMKINVMYLKVNGYTLKATLEDNSSVRELLKKLEEKDITLEMSDYGNFEKVGELEFELPKNDKQIKTQPGDIILYQGNAITIYYDVNQWNFTKLGKIENIQKEELKKILGKENVIVTFSLLP